MKNNFYLILVENYDEENTISYIFNNILFKTKDDAQKYLWLHIEEIKNAHWPERTTDFDEIDDILTLGTYLAKEDMTGKRLEVTIIKVSEYGN